LDAATPLERPPALKAPERTIATFHLALLYYARGNDQAARNMLEYVERSNDFLSPDYYLGKLMYNRIITGR
ncbi:MAG: hypothetical protein WC712_06510, partial [Candidatus Brocadiia bacterium]